MSDLDPTRLIDRVAAQAPDLDVTAEEVLDVARRRRRRRRAAAFAAVSAIAAGALWWGAAGSDLLGSGPLTPAGEDGVQGEGGAPEPTDTVLHLPGVDVPVRSSEDLTMAYLGEEQTQGVMLINQNVPRLERIGEGDMEDYRVVGAVVTTAVPDGTDVSTMTAAVDDPAEELRWLTVVDRVVVDVKGPESLVILGLDSEPQDVVDLAMGVDYPIVLGEEGADGPREAGTPATGTETVKVLVLEDEVLVERLGTHIEGRPLEGWGEDDRTYDLGPDGTGYLVAHPEGDPIGTPVAVVEDAGRITAWEASTPAYIDEGRLGLWVQLPQGVELVGLARPDEAGEMIWAGESAASPSVQVGDRTVWVGEEEGLWLARLTDDPSEYVSAGPVDGPATVRQVSEDGHQLLAVLSGDARGATVVGAREGTATEVTPVEGTDLAVVSAVLSDLDEVEGIDTDGDGAADLLLDEAAGVTGPPEGPVEVGETVQMLGTVLEVTEGEGGLPYLRALDGSLEVGPGAPGADPSTGEVPVADHGAILYVGGYAPSSGLLGYEDWVVLVRDGKTAEGESGPIFWVDGRGDRYAVFTALRPGQMGQVQLGVVEDDSGELRILP